MNVLLLALALAAAVPASAKNLRTSTPVMGWNSYNHYNCYVNETQILQNAEALVKLGLADVGYRYVVPDCGWSAANRTTTGEITWNPQYYPSGFPSLGTNLHDLGLKFGVYSGAGPWQCNPTLIQASLGHELADAKTFASWGADYLKYDNCWADGKNFVVYYPNEADPSTRFRTMADALEDPAVDRDVVYGICQWGVGEDLGDWAPSIGNSWRISNDIINNWVSVWRIVNQAVPLVEVGGVGKFNDLDMLMVGNGVLTKDESRTHFALWAIAKSPLFIGASLADPVLDATALEILGNKEVVALNQDALALPAGLKRRLTQPLAYDVWAGPLSGNRTVVAIVNWANVAQNITIDLADTGLQAAAAVRDVWDAKDIGAISGIYSTGTLAAHAIKLLVLQDTTPAGTYKLSSSSSSGATASVYAKSTSSNYIATVTGGAARRRTVRATVGSTTTSHSVTGTSYTLPLSLVSGSNAVRIVDPAGTVSSIVVAAPEAKLYPATAAALSSGAALTACPSGTCAPVGSKVTGLNTASATATFTVSVAATAGSKWVEMVYTNYDLAFDGAWGGVASNVVNATFSVNGGSGKRWEVPIAGGDWNDAGSIGVLLDGFNVGENKVAVTGGAAWSGKSLEVVGIKVVD